MTENFTTSTDPATNAAVSTTIVNTYNGVIVTLTGAGNTQTLQNPTTAATIRKFMVINNDTSTYSIPVVANGFTFTITPGEGQCFLWDGTAWGPIDLGITEIPVKVVQGGTGASALTDHGVLLGSGTGPITALGAVTNGQLLKAPLLVFFHISKNLDQAASLEPKCLSIWKLNKSSISPCISG